MRSSVAVALWATPDFAAMFAPALRTAKRLQKIANVARHEGIRIMSRNE
jgi:hypothetical protein